MKTKAIPMTEDMKSTVQNILTQQNMLTLKLQSYLEGCREGLGLDGDWQVDVRTFTFAPVPKPKKEAPKQPNKEKGEE